MIKFYTQHCPKCKVLKMKLDAKNIEYEEITDFDIQDLIDKGIKSLPILQVDDTYMKFEDAINWVREY